MVNIQQIKQQTTKLATDLAVPLFWITDWLLYVLDKPTLFLMTDEHYALTDTEIERFNTGIDNMRQGIPLAYLIGRQEFWSLDFTVNEHTLIPRPDTEILVEQVLAWIDSHCTNTNTALDKTMPKRLLDLGTGSGCIAISLAHELTAHGSFKNDWQVVAVDFSSDALKVARHNAVINGIDNIEFVESSWYQELPIHHDSLFDIIVSNPPYIDESDVHLSRLTAEPMSALSAPNKGLADIVHIIEQAPQYLKTGGLLAIEHGFDQGAAVRQLFLGNGFKTVKTVPDYGGKERVTMGSLCAVDTQALPIER